MNPRFRFLLALSAVLASLVSAADSQLLWQIGRPDNDDREFALAPNRYGQFRSGGFFVVGKSDPKRDWPYVHPGPLDGWVGARPHTFVIMFGLKDTPTAGDCKLRFDLVDTHGSSPPELRITVNGRPFNRRMPRGGGDESIFGQPAKGKEHQFEVAFPANLLRAGPNELSITTLSGSWVLYDWIGCETPASLQLAGVGGTMVSSIHSAPVLLERDGKLSQIIKLAVRHFGDETNAVIRADGAAPVPVKLRSTTETFEVAVPAVEKESRVQVALEVGGKPLMAEGLTLKPVRKWVVYLLPHSHVDIGYTHVQTDVEKAQWKYLEMAMEAARKSASYPIGSRFKWNTEVLWAVDSYLQQATPAQRQAFEAAVRNGQVGLDALYGNMLTGLCRPEELLRLLRLGPELAKRTGVPVESAMITDVPGYTWGVVPAFAHTGVKYFSIGPNGGDRIGHTISAWGDKPFWWIGPNGKDRILVWMTGTGYYRVFSSADNLLNYLGQLETKGYPYDFVQVRHCLGDNGAPDVNFADTVKQWNDTHAYPKLVIATTAEMFRDFEKRYGDQLPTAQGDFTPYWEDGAGSSARETALNRASAERLVQAETLFAMLNREAYPLVDFYQAWRNVVLYDEHTWGAHNSISEPDHPFVKSQWAIKQKFALDGDEQSRALIEKAVASRGARVAAASAKVNAIDVFNTTSFGIPWGLVVVPKELSSAGDTVRVGAPTSESVAPSQRLTSGELVFRPCCAPFGSRRYFITEGPARPLGSNAAARVEGTTLITSDSAVARRLMVRVDETSGAIASLRHEGQELVNRNASTALNDYFYLPGSDLNGVQRNGQVKISVKERGPLVASLLVESDAPGCRKLAREVRVYALRNYVEIINTVDKAPVRTKEGVHFGFGFNVPNGTVRMDVPWGIVRPESDQIRGACKNWFTVQRWVDISNDRHGVTLVTPDAPLVQVGHLTANLIGSLAGSKLWLEQLEPSQTIYSWAMNNHWHTNYRAEQDGPTVFRYYLWPHRQGFDAEEATRRALECTQPLIVAPAHGEPERERRLSVSPSSVIVTAFKPSDDGRGYIVRLFGLSDKAQKARLDWPQPAPTWWVSDNSERPLRKTEGEGIDVPAWSIVTLRAEMP